MNSKQSRPSDFFKWLEEYWPQLILCLGGIGLALSGIWLGVEKEKLNWFRSGTGIVFLISAFLSILGTVETCKRTPRIKKLQREVARLENILGQAREDYFKTFEIHLEDLANNLKFDDTDRISIYRHNGKHFLMIGRYSKNHNFSQRGRVIYPDNEGCIGVAWNKGKAFVTNLPDPLTEENNYLFDMKCQWNMPENITQKLTMKSRSYGAYAIDSIQRPSRRIAVIVFESIEANKLSDQSLQNALTGDKFNFIRQLIETMKPLEPSLKKAENEGY